MEWLKKLIAGELSKSIIRKLMVLVAGFLAGIGVDPTIVQQFCDSGTQVLIAVVLYLVAQLWSVAEKRIAKENA